MSVCLSKQSETVSVYYLSVYRRLASSKVNNARSSHVETAPNTYEMSSDENSQPIDMNDQSGDNAPVTATKPVVTNAADNDRADQSASQSQRSSINDFTLIDNDLYG